MVKALGAVADRGLTFDYDPIGDSLMGQLIGEFWKFQVYGPGNEGDRVFEGFEAVAKGF